MSPFGFGGRHRDRRYHASEEFDDPDDLLTERPSPRNWLRPAFWRESGIGVVWPIVAFLFLLALAAWGTGQLTAVFGARSPYPAVNVVDLPQMSLRGTDGRQIDVSVKVELGDGVDKSELTPKADRIYDQFVDQMSQLSAGELDGARGAAFVKAAMETAVHKEVDPAKVKGVYIDKLLVH